MMSAKVKCLSCGEILESEYTHHFVKCKCPQGTFVDGGGEYYSRYGGTDLALVGHWNEKAQDWLPNLESARWHQEEKESYRQKKWDETIKKAGGAEVALKKLYEWANEPFLDECLIDILTNLVERDAKLDNDTKLELRQFLEKNRK